MVYQAGQDNAQLPAQAAAGERTGVAGFAQLQAQIIALQTQLAQLAMAPQAAKAHGV